MTKSSKKVRSNKALQAIRRAIRRSDPTHEPPTVGKPVIVDPPEDGHRTQADPKEALENSPRRRPTLGAWGFRVRTENLARQGMTTEAVDRPRTVAVRTREGHRAAGHRVYAPGVIAAAAAELTIVGYFALVH